MESYECAVQALEESKPILVVTETEERFWPFSLSRWQRDECEKVPGSWPLQWKQCWLQTPYAKVPPLIKDFIETTTAQNLVRLAIFLSRRPISASLDVQMLCQHEGMVPSYAKLVQLFYT